MKYPKCIEENKESKVHPGILYITATYYPPFYDEKGNYHNHDNNRTTTNYRCSNGHDFSKNLYSSC